jgi:S1-C subfamily serine protease
MKYLTFLFVLILGVVTLWPSGPQDKYVDVVDKVLPTVVEIRVTGDVELKFFDTAIGTATVGILGSGVFIHPKGYVLTCKHLFDDFIKIHSISIIMYNGQVVSGEILELSDHDLAIVKAGYVKNVKFARLAVPSTLRVGQEVLAIGSPKGLSFSVSLGIISSLHRDFPWAYNTTQSDVAINPGNSGGPLFNLKGQLVGINSFFVPADMWAPVNSGLGFSVQVGQCLEFIVRSAKTIPDFRRFKWLPTIL